MLTIIKLILTLISKYNWIGNDNESDIHNKLEVTIAVDSMKTILLIIVMEILKEIIHDDSNNKRGSENRIAKMVNKKKLKIVVELHQCCHATNES